jgi:hypothetical protein
MEQAEPYAASIGGDALVVLPRHVVCMASHGRGRSAALLGSVVADLAGMTAGALVLVGPHVPEDHRLGDNLVVCVDGSETDEAAVPAAASWAAAPGLDLSIVTVAEPVAERPHARARPPRASRRRAPLPRGASGQGRVTDLGRARVA